MAWARFTADFDWRVPPAPWTRAYRAGGRYAVRRSCLDQATALGRAVAIPSPSRAAAAILTHNPFWKGDDATEIGG